MEAAFAPHESVRITSPSVSTLEGPDRRDSQCGDRRDIGAVTYAPGRVPVQHAECR